MANLLTQSPAWLVSTVQLALIDRKFKSQARIAQVLSISGSSKNKIVLSDGQHCVNAQLSSSVYTPPKVGSIIRLNQYHLISSKNDLMQVELQVKSLDVLGGSGMARVGCPTFVHQDIEIRRILQALAPKQLKESIEHACPESATTTSNRIPTASSPLREVVQGNESNEERLPTPAASSSPKLQGPSREAVRALVGDVHAVKEFRQSSMGQPPKTAHVASLLQDLKNDPSLLADLRRIAREQDKQWSQKQETARRKRQARLREPGYPVFDDNGNIMYIVKDPRQIRDLFRGLRAQVSKREEEEAKDGEADDSGSETQDPTVQKVTHVPTTQTPPPTATTHGQPIVSSTMLEIILSEDEDDSDDVSNKAMGINSILGVTAVVREVVDHKATQAHQDQLQNRVAVSRKRSLEQHQQDGVSAEDDKQPKTTIPERGSFFDSWIQAAQDLVKARKVVNPAVLEDTIEGKSAVTEAATPSSWGVLAPFLFNDYRK